ncbi:FAD dependent oxidoreductase [Cnuella takakiae]|uniref:FAD dependent oxidoreductase n=1 Tax=Cnuella takakiae TaxID=1302690 RepID=A0A1M5I7N8_9BACT|nr:FAD-dependent oxidoreductase [Cnuella takakiae]OLY93207.1 hypothetical protein BUE76_15910 [Cnuella takakiae]SHG24262.1 FAD dependent oxidoreductase [Cnuella takakiae]
MLRLLLYFLCFPLLVLSQRRAQVLVVGGGTGGTAAAIQAARSGAKTLLIEPTTMLGGMLTAAGVSCTDGNHLLNSGMWQEFREALYRHYGTRNLGSGWVSNTCFEPFVGDSILKAMAAAEPNLEVVYGFWFTGVNKKGNRIEGARFTNKKGEKLDIVATVTIDATDLGDVLASAGAAFYLGMDDPKATGEKEAQERNGIIQDLTWTAILKDYGVGVNRTIPKPVGYDATRYYCSNLQAPCPNGKPWNGDVQKMLEYGRLTTRDSTEKKYMLNWPIHGNDTYLDVVQLPEAQRQQAYAKAKEQTLGFLYFLQNDLGLEHIGLADDELEGGMALVPYHREGRRLRGKTLLAIHHLQHPCNYNLFQSGIAVGNYPVDHHHGQYMGKVPDLEFPPIPAFNIPLGALIPETVGGLIVCDKSISVSNIANGSTRLQPVVLLTGQAAGVLAAKSAMGNRQPAVVPVREVQADLIAAKAYLMPFTDLTPDDPHWAAIQRVGVRGLLKGEGKPEAWANKMLFHPDSLTRSAELLAGLQQVPAFKTKWVQGLETNNSSFITGSWLFDLLAQVQAAGFKPAGSPDAKALDQFYQKAFNKSLVPSAPMPRREVAVILDAYIQPLSW